MDNLHYTTVECPLGTMLVVATDGGIREMSLGAGVEPPKDGLPDPGHPVVSAATAALQRYFDGSEDLLRLPLDVTGTVFQRSVWDALRKIPRGQTRPYSALARSLGLSAGASRAVGAACGANPVAIAVPCHRAVGADASLTGYRGGLPIKRRLLELEGALAPPLPDLL